MSSNPGAMLARLIKEGTAPDQAASAVLAAALGDEVLADLDRGAREWLFGLVLHVANNLEGREANRRMKQALGAGGVPAGTERFRQVTEKLRSTFYHLPDGARVLWDDLGIDEIEAKIALLRKQVGQLVEHLNVLEAARDLLAERSVSRLGDIPDWPELVRKMTERKAA